MVRDAGVLEPELTIEYANGVPLHTTPPSVVAELRYAVARIQADDAGGVPCVVGVLSAISGEGVTFVTRSLATVLARDLDRSVCIAEANWWSGPPAPQSDLGLADVVIGAAQLDDALQETRDRRLWHLPAGSIDPLRRASLARAQEMAKALTDLAARFDHVLLDLPAVLTTSDALALAVHCHGSLLVVQQGATRVTDVKHVLRELSGTPLLGVIMNRATTPIPEYLYSRLDMTGTASRRPQNGF